METLAKPMWIFNEARDDGVAVASAGPYASHVHLAADRSVHVYAIHTHMNRPNSSLDWVLSHWAHFTVLRFICVLCITVYCMHA